VITILGIPIHEFSVAFSDFLLFLESILLAWMLSRPTNGVRKSGRYLFLFLGASSLLGAAYHAFFSDAPHASGGVVIWMLTAASIGFVATALWDTLAGILIREKVARLVRIFARIGLALYLGVIVFVNDDYLTVILFYAPPVLLLGGIALWKSVTTSSVSWRYLAVGIALSLGAAAIQSLKISLDPTWLNFNTLYHLMQGVALPFIFAFYRTFRPET
jgi:hypothetical protein